MRAAATLVAIVTLTACGGADTTDPAGEVATTAAPDATSTDTETPTATDTEMAGSVATADSDLGTILVDGDGVTLYVFDNDTDGSSTCYDECAEAWPPLIGEVSAAGEVDASLLGTTERTDGTMQVTYDGQPLYYFAGDGAAGDTNGQAVNDIWWVVGPDGAKITGAASSGGSDPGY